MIDFFNMLSDFLASDFGKSYGWLFLVCCIVCLLIGVIITYFICNKLIIPSKTLKESKIEEENENLKKQLKEANEKMSKLKEDLRDYDVERALNKPYEFKDRAFEPFTKK